MFFTVVVLPVLGREVVKFKSRRLHNAKLCTRHFRISVTYVQKLGFFTKLFVISIGRHI